MKTYVISAVLAVAAAGAFAKSSVVNMEAVALRYECGVQQTAKHAVKAKDANTFVYVYRAGTLVGEATDGAVLECSSKDYSAFLATVDPVRVQAAYPTASGRTAVKAVPASK
jgi:hypothetical protein